MVEKAASERGPAPSISRLDGKAKKANVDWMSRMTNREKKRKADPALQETDNPLPNKSPKLSKAVPAEIIVIEDSLPSTQPQEAANLDDRPRGARRAKLRHTQNEEQTEGIQTVLKNLRDQVTDWTLRVQQNEASLETLRAKIGDAPDTMLQENIREIITKELSPLIERIERVENNHLSYHYAQTQFPSAQGHPKTMFKAPTTQLDKLSTYQSTAYEKLTHPSSTASDGQAKGGKYAAAKLRGSSSERVGAQLDVLQGIGISMEDAYWRAPALSNKGFKRLLHKIDFRNTEQLRVLNALDDCTTPRDCILFCDSQTFGMYQVDYILRTGTTATYVRDARVPAHETKLHDRGLSGLRVHELEISYSTDDPKDKRRFKEWKSKSAFPKYVYDMGQLFLRRHGRDRHDLLGTQYNLMIDVAKPRKPIWLVMRPEYTPMVFGRREKESSAPFPGRATGLNGVGIAKLADAIKDLDFCQGSFEKRSFPKYSKAEKLIESTRFKGRLTFGFSTADIDQMEAKVVAG